MNLSRYRRRVTAARGALAGLALALGFGPAHAEQLLTSWRSADLTWYVTGCHDEAGAIEVAEHGPQAPRSEWLGLFQSGRCFVLREPARAKLLRWVSGPYGASPEDSLSLWLIIDEFGDREYVLLPDFNGPHEPAVHA